jgi:hypothetical protein
MNLISTSWRCQFCGVTCISAPSEHGLCDQCQDYLQALARASLPDTVPCPSCSGPVCPDCGDAMALLLTVPAPAPGSSAAQADQLITGYRTHRHDSPGSCTRATPPDQTTAPPRIALTATQAQCLRDMLADAIAHTSAPATGCPRCQGNPAELCQEHSPAWSVIQAYRQLAADLGEVTGDER